MRKDSGCEAASARPLLVVIRQKALQRRPRLDQRAVHAEVLVGNPAVAPAQLDDLGEEQVGYGMGEQAILVRLAAWL